jgi:glucose-6-phosphate 1-epimerase
MVKIIGATDRAYESAPSESQVFLTTNVIFTLYRKNFADVVVWNPYEEGAASIGDFEPKDGWKNMVLLSHL